MSQDMNKKGLPWKLGAWLLIIMLIMFSITGFALRVDLGWNLWQIAGAVILASISFTIMVFIQAPRDIHGKITKFDGFISSFLVSCFAFFLAGTVLGFFIK